MVLIASAEARIIGTLDFEGHRRPQQRHAGIFGMSVRREFPGKGVGTANIAAIRLYERLGFEHEGRRVGAVIVAGQPVDILQMARRLAA